MSKAAKGKRTKRVITARQKRNWLCGYAFILPWLIGVLVFFVYSVFFSLRIATTSVYFDHGIQFAPLANPFVNFISIFNNAPDYILTLVSYVGTILLKVPMIVAFSLIIAIFLNDKFPGRTFYRLLFFLPVIVATGPVMSSFEGNGVSIYDVTALANLLRELPDVIFDVFSDIFSSLLTVLWQSGVPILIFLAGLQKISINQYEAAQIDGASPWDVFWKITLPSIRPFILLNAIYSIIFISADDTAPIRYIKNAVNDSTKGYSVSIAMAWMYALLIILLLLVAYLILKEPKEKVQHYDQKLDTVRAQRRHEEEKKAPHQTSQEKEAGV